MFKSIPLLTMRGNIVFPQVRTRIEIARERSKNTVKFAAANHEALFIVSQINPQEEPLMKEDLYGEGVLAEITQLVDAGVSLLLDISVFSPAKLTRADFSSDVSLCDIEPYEYVTNDRTAAYSLYESVCKYALNFCEFNNALNKKNYNNFIPKPDVDITYFINSLSNDVVLSLPERQAILAEHVNETRLELLAAFLFGAINLAKAEKRIANRVKKQVEQGQKEYYLREQMKAISQELGDDDNEQNEFLEKIKKSGMPEEIAAKATKEAKRLAKMSVSSPDATIIRNYLDCLCDLPWVTETKDNTDLKRAREILDEDHYGLDKIKDRIIEFLAVMQLTHKLNGPILCFVGPPGVGKTSIVRSIARALDRKYMRVSLGGVSDEAEIRGHRRTYVGALPGKIIYMMKQAGCVNPVMLFDEIDKMGKDNRGDPSSAMLEVLDPEQNNTFTDHFLEVPYDLSKVLFVCTANATDDIPAPLLDRMEIIELSGYTELEKIAIAHNFLLGKNLEKHGIPDGRVVIDDDTYQKIIERYTRESGVRSLEREIAAICRKVALKLVEDENAEIEVNADNLTEYLGVERFKDESIDYLDTVGSACGLAWTRVGGTTLNVDAALFEGKGDIQLTGNLGDVMKESARTAISLVKSLSVEYGIDKERFEKTDIHIHVPEGAIPKDGPSAGVTMATVVMSAFTGKPVSGKVAMTGEITLRGKVLPIGGLKEKALAAYRMGIKKVIIPKDNERDLEELPKEIAADMQFVLADKIETVYDNALI